MAMGMATAMVAVRGEEIDPIRHDIHRTGNTLGCFSVRWIHFWKAGRSENTPNASLDADGFVLHAGDSRLDYGTLPTTSGGQPLHLADRGGHEPGVYWRPVHGPPDSN